MKHIKSLQPVTGFRSDNEIQENENLVTTSQRNKTGKVKSRGNLSSPYVPEPSQTSLTSMASSAATQSSVNWSNISSSAPTASSLPLNPYVARKSSPSAFNSSIA